MIVEALLAFVIFMGLFVMLLPHIGKPTMPWHYHPKPKPLISLLVPYRGDNGGRRDRNWAWLRDFYENSELRGHIEIIMGSDSSTPFCKTHAVNDAFRIAKGDVICILDADCYIRPDVILSAAQQIRDARKRRRKLWFIPYLRFYRLTEQATDRLLCSDPVRPVHIPDPPPYDWYEHKHNISSGHWWGALIQIMPREAFVAAGGMDENFRGWGGEDISFMFAIDTLWARHKTMNNEVCHLWHPTIKGFWKYTKQWDGQPEAEMNDALAGKYADAVGDLEAMRKLTNPSKAGPRSQELFE